MIITGTNVTIDDILKMEVDKESIVNDAVLKDMKEYGIPSLPLEDLNMTDITIDLSDCNNWNMKNMKTFVSNEWSDFKQNYLWVLKQKKTEDNKSRNARIKKEFINIWTKIKEAFIGIWTDIKMQYDNVIKFFVSNYKKIIKWFKGLIGKNLTKDEKIKRRKEIKTELKRLGLDIYEMFGIYIIVDFIKHSWNIMKNLFGCKKNAFNDALNRTKELDEFLNEPELKKSKRLSKFINLMPGISQSFGLLLVTTSAIIDIINAQRKINDEQLNDFVEQSKNTNIKLNNINQTHDISDLSSLEIEINNTEKNNIKNVISICPVYDNDTANIITESNGYIIEFAKNLSNFKINVEVGENISLNKKIGYINDIPIESKIEGIVTYKTDRHIVIDKNKLNDDEVKNKIDSLITDISNNSKSTTENEINVISEKLMNMTNIEIIIKDYIDLLYKPIVYGNSNDININNQIIPITADTIYKKIKNDHKILKDNFENDIKHICSADNIKKYTDNDNLQIIKDIIINKKYTFIDDIFKLLNSYNNEQYYVLDDYNMCDEYLNFLLAEHDDNPYYDKLNTLIKNFYVERYEYENKNKNDLITKFNNYLKEDKIINKSFNIIKNDTQNNENIKDYLNELYKSVENKSTRINILLNLYDIINLINNKKDSKNDKSLKDITINEANILLNVLNDLKTEYNSYKKVINDISELYNIIDWPNYNEVYINNVKYEHYLFTDSTTSLNEIEEFNEDLTSGISGAQVNSFKYWLKYCTIATAINCAMPTYWATGLNIMGTPILMPIILIPIKYISGKVSGLIGLGICGITIYPMMLIINMSDEIGSAILMINTALEYAKQLLIDTRNIQYNSLSNMCKNLISQLDKKIINTQNKIKDINKEIALYKNL